MKNFFVLFIITLFLAACFSPWQGDEGNLTIAWGQSGNGRSLDLSLIPRYVVTLKGSGGTVEKEFLNVTSGTISVIPGTWSVTVKGYERDDSPGGSYNDLVVYGLEYPVEIKAGKKENKSIGMYDACEAGNWIKVRDYCSSLYGSKSIVLITGSFDTVNLVTAGLPNQQITIDGDVILVAEKPVTIRRGRSGGVLIPGSFVNIDSARSLTLGLPGMTGTITFDGNDDGTPTATVMNNSGNLIMNDGVTIRNNRVAAVSSGGAVTVIGNGHFIMNGGTIYDNIAGPASGNPGNGGGVCLFSAGNKFTMNGGTITRNTCLPFGTTPGKGGGVYRSGTFIWNGGTISGNSPDNIYP